MKDNNIEDLGAGFQKIEIDLSRFNSEPDLNSLAILPTRNLVLFPGLTISFELGRESAYELARMAHDFALPIGVVCQLSPDEEKPAVTTGLYKYGVIADVLAIFDRPDGTHGALVRSRSRFRILGKGMAGESMLPGLHARVRTLPDFVEKDSPEFTLAIDELKKLASKVLKDAQPVELRTAWKQIDDNETLVNFLCTNTPFENANKVALLAKQSVTERCIGLMGELNIFNERLKITEEIANKARMSMEENQRNAFLQQQMEAIRDTLYGDVDEVDELLEKANNAGMPEAVLTLFKKESEKLRRFNPNSPDYSVLYSYLDLLHQLPWNKQTPLSSDFKLAEEILHADHYGLEKVKERIVEQLAVMMHNPTGKSPIICLVGAPGVGKTSIGKSVARALGRKYERVSFGGLHDEAEIRGHRRTYIGAMPGRIIDAIKRAGVNNPVLLLDEIDKIGNDYKGDPAAALLEVLDPEQNCHFHDNYIDVDFDLSNVLFIATANSLSSIPRPLLDRMEIIDIPGYLLEEKMEIARRHLIPRLSKELEIDGLDLSDAALTAVIRNYTAESGVRGLEKKLAALARKKVLAQMKKTDFPEKVEPENLYELLGLAPYMAEKYEGNDFAGLVTGLAWTEVGGEILMVESSAAPSKAPALTLTGKLGDVMKESASIAFQWVKSNAHKLGIDSGIFEHYSIHVHFPEGAVPKDGPSAGITIATSLVSLLKQCKVAPKIAMTGEITLRGKVLPVGGIREKILAAKRAGIDTLIMSIENKRDIDDMPQQYREGLSFHFVKTVDDVIAVAVTDQKVDNPVEFQI
ncbi:MAG: endopeptidase La [Muribaculaceae bacterium]|nr:endopeptidase La [Muribaculaceae bacterium]